MDEKAVWGFITWLFIGIGLFTMLTTPIGTMWTLLGNLLGLLLLVAVFRLPQVRERVDRPEPRSLMMVLGLLALGTAVSLGLGWVVQQLIS